MKTRIRVVVAVLLLALGVGSCREAGMSDITLPDDIPTITEQRLANGKRSFQFPQFPEGLSPENVFPARWVVRDVDGSILSDQVLHAPPPPRAGPPKPLTAKQEEKFRDILRLAQEKDPENFPAKVEKLRQIGFPEHLLSTTVSTEENK